jgi:hypothetical protein
MLLWATGSVQRPSDNAIVNLFRSGLPSSTKFVYSNIYGGKSKLGVSLVWYTYQRQCFNDSQPDLRHFKDIVSRQTARSNRDPLSLDASSRSYRGQIRISRPFLRLGTPHQIDGRPDGRVHLLYERLYLDSRSRVLELGRTAYNASTLRQFIDSY